MSTPQPECEGPAPTAMENRAGNGAREGVSEQDRGEASLAAQALTRVAIDDIFESEGRRPVDQEKVASLADSMTQLGLLQPILTYSEGGRIRLVAGAYRLAAARKLGWSHINAAFVDGNDVRLRLAKIAENLHRAELTALERDELTAEWIALTEADQKVLRQSDAKPKRGRPEGGIRAAARRLLRRTCPGAPHRPFRQP